MYIYIYMYIHVHSVWIYTYIYIYICICIKAPGPRQPRWPSGAPVAPRVSNYKPILTLVFGFSFTTGCLTVIVLR